MFLRLELLLQHADKLGRNTAHDAEGGHIARDHRASAHHSSAANAHIWRNDAVGANPHVFFNNNLTRDMGKISP